MQLLGRINANLTVYTGLVETARTNNRAGNPVGSSYLSEASSLMQQTILPDAQRLYEETSARVDRETTASTRIPAPVILVVLATLLFGAFANRWLARRTRRRVNIGFVAGGIAVLIMLIWVFTALVISTIDSRSAKNTAAESLKTVTTLAITAQQARADETLSLIRRGDESVRKQSYYQRIDTMQQQLSEYLGRDDAIDKSDLSDAEQLLRALACRRRPDQRLHRGRQLPGRHAGRAGHRRGRLDARVRQARRGAVQRHPREPQPVAQRHHQRPAGAVRRDRRGAVLSRDRGDRGGAGAVATNERVPMMSACAKNRAGP